LLELEDPKGVALASHQLPSSTNCAELADAVAVILAAWEAQFSHEVAPPPKQPAPAREVVSATNQTASTTQSSPAASRHAVGFAGLVLATADGQDVGVAGEIDGSYDHLTGLLLVESPHSATLAPGQLHWQRTSLGAGGRLWTATGRWEFSGRALLLAALLTRWGSGYGVDQSSTSPDLGIALGARVTLRVAGSLGLMADLSAVAWPLTQTMVVAGVPGSYTLPNWELFAGIGLGYSAP
jgi:hypothetical protein